MGALIAAGAGALAGAKNAEERERIAERRFEQRISDSCAPVRNTEDRARCENYVRADLSSGFPREN